MRIAIVNDSKFGVEALRRILFYVPEHELAWEASDGAEAVEKCGNDTPDLILMDLIMPVMDGAEATRQIMEASPCAILIVTASVGGNAGKVFQAMGNGALDAIDTPAGEPGGEGGDSLLAKIATIGKLLGEGVSSRSDVAVRPRIKAAVPPLVVIGASTGGPMALAAILSGLPEDFAGAIVIVQHVDIQFSAGLSSWLDTQSSLPVALAEKGTLLRGGRVWVAGTNNHIIMTPNMELRYDSRVSATPYHPSIDIFFDSVAEHWPEKGTAVLLTGMGRDGANGLKKLRDKGWHTIAQDEKTSVVYGMPKEAAQLGAAAEVLPIDKIGMALKRSML